MPFRKEPLGVKIYVSAVILACLPLLFFHNPADFLNPTIVFFIILHLALENMDVNLPHNRGSISVGFATSLAIILLFGPGPAVWASFVTILHFRTFEHRHALYKPLFNAAQLTLAAGLAAYAYLLVGGVPGQVSLPQAIFPMVVTVLVFFAVNAILVMGIMSLTQKRSFFNVWGVIFKWAIPNYFAVSPLGMLIASVYASMGVYAVILLMIPLMLARHTFILYQEMRSQYINTIKALAKAVDAKDHYTHGHSERVADFAVAIARELNLPEVFQEKLEYLALMHDIGKISIPETILNKPGNLTDKEFALIRTHPQVGAEIIRDIKFIGQYTDSVRHHHERIDGLGYPDRLLGEEISLGAKIIGVADAFDAMTSVRGYCKIKSKQEAMAELERCCNTQFCHEVVSAFEKVLRRRGEIS